jgi:Winged helix-turn helix
MPQQSQLINGYENSSTAQSPSQLSIELSISTPIGRPKTVDDAYIQRLEALVRQSPKVLGYSFDRWTAHWLRKHLLQESGIAVTERHINRLLRQMGLSTRQRLQLHQGKLSRCTPILIKDLSISELS